MSNYIIIPKDMLAEWDMLSDGELGSIVRTLIRYETTDKTKVFTEKHVRACYCSLVAVQRMHDREEAEREAEREERQREEEGWKRAAQTRSEHAKRAARTRWWKRDAQGMLEHDAQSMLEHNEHESQSGSGLEGQKGMLKSCSNLCSNHARASVEHKNHVDVQPAPIVEQEELHLESPDAQIEKTENAANKKRETKEKNQKKDKSKEIVHTTPTNSNFTVTGGVKEKKENIKKEEKTRTPGAQGVASGRRLAAKDIAMLYPEEKAAWQEWSKIYPAHRRAPAGPEIMEFVRLKGLVARKTEIFQTILTFQQQDADWKNGYIPRMTKFFKEERYENAPAPEQVVRKRQEVVTHYIRQFKPEEEETTFNPNLFANDKPKEQHG